MVRIATVNDAEQLNILNDEFNGESETSIDNIRNSLMNNKQEVVIVADEDDMLVGFVCVQLKKSFCYDEYMPEITEVYVKPAYRKRGLASEMITFAEAYCSKNYPLHQYELLTGQENLVAQTVYNKLGYVDDNELHLSKRVKTERVYTRSATYQKFEVLKTNRNKRYKYGEFFVEGVRNINNAVENGWEIVSFLYDGDRKLSDWARDKLAAVRTQVNYALRGDLLAALSGKADTSELLGGRQNAGRRFFAHPAFGKPADRAVRPPLEPRQSRHDPALLRRARRGGADPDRARRGPVRPGRRFLDDGLVLLRAGGPHVGQRLGFCVDRRAEGALPGLSGGGHDGAPRKDAFGSGLHKADDAADRQRDRGPAPHLQGAQRRARDDSDESARLGQFLQRGLRRHSHVLRSRAPTRGGNVPRRSRGGRVLRDSQILI